jgi:hypothetical protein
MGIIAASRLRGVLKEPNFFIGGVGDELSNTSEVATMFENLSSNDIELYSVDSQKNIKFYVDPLKYFTLSTSYFSMFSRQSGYWFAQGWGRTLTYFIDKDNLIKMVPLTFFMQQRNLNFIKLEGSTTHQQRVFQDVAIESYRFPNLNNLTSFQVYRINPFMERFYAPLLNQWGLTTGFDQLFSQNDPFVNPKKAYCDLSILTANNGNPDEDLAYLINSSFTSQEVVNTINPNPITNLQLSNITSNSVDVSFDAPTGSANAIDFYEIFLIDGSDLNNFKPITESTTNSLTLSGLESGRNYLIKVKAADIYWNLSNPETSQSFTTL